MTSRAQKAAAVEIAAALVRIAEADHGEAETFAVDVAAITAGIPERVARRVLDDYPHTINPLIGPRGLRITSNKRPKVEVER